MFIKKIKSQIRRDFIADIECENCRNIRELRTGYDDRNYHDNVLPNMKCPECGKSRNDLGLKGDFRATKYADDQII